VEYERQFGRHVSCGRGRVRVGVLELLELTTPGEHIFSLLPSPSLYSLFNARFGHLIDQKSWRRHSFVLFLPH
jgi:hypothetical protein